MSAWRLLITRPEAEAQALVTELAHHGHHASAMPMLRIEPLSPLPRPSGWLQQFDAVIVVSKPAALLCLNHLQPALGLPRPQWFAVGPATAAILHQQGLEAAFAQGGDDSEALWQLPALREALALPGARVLIARGEGGREWLADRLKEAGAQVEYLELYRRCVPDYPPGALAERLKAERLNGVVVSSGQGLEHLHRLAGAAWVALATLPLFVPSARVAALAEALGSRNPVNCGGANSAALIAALASRSP